MPVAYCTSYLCSSPIWIRLMINVESNQETQKIVFSYQKTHEIKPKRHIKRNYTVRLMAPGNPSKKAGQPHPESNFVVDLQRGVLHPTQLKIPSSKNLSYSPVPAILKHFHQNVKTDPFKNSINKFQKKKDSIYVLVKKIFFICLPCSLITMFNLLIEKQGILEL